MNGRIDRRYAFMNFSLESLRALIMRQLGIRDTFLVFEYCFFFAVFVGL